MTYPHVYLNTPLSRRAALIRLLWVTLTAPALILLPSLCDRAVSYGYNFIGAQWVLAVDQSIPYKVNSQLSADLNDEDCLSGVQLGFQVWNDISCSYMSWQFSGRTESTGWGVNDEENVVSWRESSWDDSSAALAITSTIFDFRGLQDTDIKFNGANYTWSLIVEGAGSGQGVDVASVSAHEVGHALGLDHSQVSGATMWPSTGPGNASNRSLAQDDVDAACELYPSGGDRPTVPADTSQPTVGTADFGEDCSDEYCAAPYFCISDGRTQYCTSACSDTDPCPDNYYCAQLSTGSGACALGEPPSVEQAGFNEECGEMLGCEQGLTCVSDGDVAYCTSACDGGACPDGFECVQLQGGGDVCARGSDDPLPVFGELCGEDGRCDEALFCLSDQLYTDRRTGEVLPYCSRSCDGGCPEGYRCAQLQAGADACQKEPSAGDRIVGDECWVNPETPFDDPVCPEGLRCVDFQRDGTTQEVIVPGYCTQTCTAETCCPVGWGCQAVTPFLALCAEGVEDDEGFYCEGERPTLASGEDEASGGMDLGGEEFTVAGDKEAEGCAQGYTSPNGARRDLTWLWCISLLGLALSRARQDA